MNLPQPNAAQRSLRGTQIALGLFWLLDGLLKLQPQMFTANFANAVIAPAAFGQPGFIADPMNQAIKLFASQPVTMNIIIALLEWLVGALIIVKVTARVGLAISIPVALLIWFYLEGMSGMPSGQSSLLTGLPGAALIYALLAVGVLPPRRQARSHKPQAVPHKWLNLAWVGIWLLGAAYQLLPGQNSALAIASAMTGAANGAPGWLGVIVSHAAIAVRGGGLWLVIVLTILEAAIGISALMPEFIRRPAIYAGMILTVVLWIVGQDLGQLYSGTAPDPGTGPLMILLALAVLGAGQLLPWPKET